MASLFLLPPKREALFTFAFADNHHSMKKNIFFVLLSFTIIPSLSMAQAIAKPKAMLNHIAVYVSDLTKSGNFYINIIGLDSIPEPFHDGKHIWLATGTPANLHLIMGPDANLPHNKNNHLCFSVTDLDAFITRLKENNIGYENWPGDKEAVTTRVDGVKQIYFQDPDGYWIEINDAKN